MNGISELERLLAIAISENSITESFKSEQELLRHLVLLRNVGDCIHDHHDVSGMLFTKYTDFIKNEIKFNILWDTIYKLHISDCDSNMLATHTDNAKLIIDKLCKSPMWHEVSDDDMLSSGIPSFRIASVDYYNTRMQSILNNAKSGTYIRPPNTFSDMESDRILHLRDDLAHSKIKEVTLSSYVRLRLLENNPHYNSHPLEYLLITVMFIRRVAPHYVHPGMVYLNELMLTLNQHDDYKFHLPLEFKSDGRFAGSQFHSHVLLHFKVILNSMSLLLVNYDIHRFEPTYIAVSDEIITYILNSNVIDSGRKIKKLLTLVNLYYGMSLTNYEKEGRVHLHPQYPNFVRPTSSRPVSTAEFCPSMDCYSCPLPPFGRAVYTKNIRDGIERDIKLLADEGLHNLVAYIRDKLLDCRPDKSIIHDLVFLRIHMNAGGYSHTHQLTDFNDQILESIKDNQEYINTLPQHKERDWVFQDMKQTGYDITTMCIDKCLYPTSSEFKRSIYKYTTSKSSGLMPVEVNFEFVQSQHDRRKNMTSKHANLMILGDKALNLNTLNLKYLTNEEFEMSLTIDERSQWIKGSLPMYYILSKRSISRIGSRATVAFRPTRPIYINALTMHFAQAAILGPHVELSNLRLREAPSSIYPSVRDMGNGISTMFQDGTTNLVAQSVMASAHGTILNVCADASSWDQHYPTELIDAYLYGIRDAIIKSQHFNDQYYMYMDSTGVTIPEIISWLQQAHKDKMYVASYANSNILYPVNFMTSGSLYTFYLNSILNIVINKRISLLLNKYNCTYEYIMEAGDDSLALMSVPTNFSAKMVEDVKETIKNIYSEANQKINIYKTSVTSNSGEFAKIYWYWGMIFRDPSIQWFESEKESKAESYIEKIRGYGQKLFEASRRAIGDMRINAVYARLILGVSYHLNARIKEDSRQDNFLLCKYYPPFNSIITPTSYKGGLGYSLSGIALNEVQVIINHMRKSINLSLYIIDSINFDTDRGAINGIFKYYYPKKDALLSSISNETKFYKLKNISFASDDSNVVNGNFKYGLDFQLSQLRDVKIRKSNEAADLLRRNGIEAPLKYKYDNLPYYNFYNTIDIMSTDKEAVTKSLQYNISKLFKFQKGRIDLAIDTSETKMDIMDKYHIYAAFDVTLHAIDTEPRIQNHVRYVSAPSWSYNMERRYGSANNKHYTTHLRGSNSSILRFIKINGLSLTEGMLMSVLIDSGAFIANDPRTTLKNILTYISGDENSSSVLADELISENISWEHELLSMQVSGTVLENMNLSYQIVSEYTVAVDGIHPGLRKLMQYIAFIYTIQYSALTDAKCYTARIGVNPKYAELIKNLTARQTVGSINKIIYQLIRDNRALRNHYLNHITDDRMLL